MSRPVCSLFPGLDTRAHHLHDRLPITYPDYALSDRRWVTCVIRPYASTTVKDARHLGRGDATIHVGEARA
jgi:hypothetical protein